MLVDELVAHIDTKIATLKHQKSSLKTITKKASITLQQEPTIFTTIKQHIQEHLKIYHNQTQQTIKSISQHYQKRLSDNQQLYDSQVEQLQRQINRQHNVIVLMRQEVEDLMVLVNLTQQEKMERDSRGDSRGEGEDSVGIHNLSVGRMDQKPDMIKIEDQEDEEDEDHGFGNMREEPHHPTVSGLEIIEEETERTHMSSARSASHRTEEYFGATTEPNFIKIQQNQDDHNQFLQNQPRANSASFHKNLHFEQAQDSIRGNSCRPCIFQQDDSNRQYTYTGNNTENSIMQDSVQFSQEDKYFQFNHVHLQPKLLKDISNRMEDKPKAKEFLEEFRKTFNKCLSSIHVTRKNSNKTNVKKARQYHSGFIQLKQENKKHELKMMTFGKQNKQNSREPKGKNESQSQKLIYDMLKDIDNCTKFNVGTKKIQVKYEGQKKQANRCGNGVLYYNNGLCYEGQFKNNFRNGYGVLKFNHIEIYNGEWINDELSGQGKIRNFAIINRKKSQPSNSPLIKWVSYCGQFKGNKFEGQGTLYLQGGQKFLGKFIGGMACGEGTFYRKNGEVQTGVWRNNQIVERF